jgi:hypothetical protein
LKVAPEALRQRVYAAFEGQMYQPAAFFAVVEKTGVDWLARERRMVEFFNSKLASLLTPDEQRQIERINFMTAPSNVVNAMILRDQSDVVVVFNLSMHTMFRLYVEWFMAACEATRVHDEPAMVQASCRLVQIAELGLTGHAPVLFPDKHQYNLFSRTILPVEAIQMIDICTSVAQFFVLAHELGHFVLGHMDNDQGWLRVASGSSLELMNLSQQMEHAADTYALNVLGRVRNVPAIGIAFALNSLFSMFAVSEFVAGVIARASAHISRSSPLTHPDATVRINIARNYITDDLELFDVMRQVSSFVSDFAWRELSGQPAG